MAAHDGAMEAAIRAIVRSGEDVRNGWSDRQIVAQARRRTGADADTAAESRLAAMVAAIRSEADNDGQTLTRAGDTSS